MHAAPKSMFELNPNKDEHRERMFKIAAYEDCKDNEQEPKPLQKKEKALAKLANIELKRLAKCIDQARNSADPASELNTLRMNFAGNDILSQASAFFTKNEDPFRVAPREACQLVRQSISACDSQ